MPMSISNTIYCGTSVKKGREGERTDRDEEGNLNTKECMTA